MPNKTIIDNLKVLLTDAKASKEAKDKFRARSYANAIKAIEKCDYEIESGKEALKLSGIGKGIAEKIQEIIDTGSLKQVSDLGEEIVNKTVVIGNFCKIWGVGPAKAEELWKAGARSVDDVHSHMDLLTTNQKIGLKYFDDLQKRIPRVKVKDLGKKIAHVIEELEKERGWTVERTICGSYRRRVETCGDMDVLLCEESNVEILADIIKRLQELEVLDVTLAIGPTKYMGLAKVDGVMFRVDMEVIPPVEWPFALLYFTGSGNFNQRQRNVAKEKGYSLSEHGMKDVKTGEYVPGMKYESDIFKFLGMKYLAPWDRT